MLHVIIYYQLQSYKIEIQKHMIKTLIICDHLQERMKISIHDNVNNENDKLVYYFWRIRII